MGQASSSSSAASAIDNRGAGTITHGSDNSIMWIVLGLVALVGLVLWKKGRK